MADIEIDETLEEVDQDGLGSNETGGGDPITVDPEEVIVEEDDGEIDQVEEDDPRQYCNGLFAWFNKSDFTQDDRYSDVYLKQKGLFKEVDEEEE